MMEVASLLSPNPLSLNQMTFSEDEGTLIATYNILWTCESASNDFGSSIAWRNIGDQGNYFTFKRYDASSVAFASTVTSTYIYRLFFHYGGGTAQFSCPASVDRVTFPITECLYHDRVMEKYGFKELSIRFMGNDCQLLDSNGQRMLAWLLDRGHGHGDPRYLEGWAKKKVGHAISNEFSEDEQALMFGYANSQRPHPLVPGSLGLDESDEGRTGPLAAPNGNAS